jgi:diketogulonate reductase-like aldo/keto reductase
VSGGASELTLGDGVRIPEIGFGTFQIPPDETQQAVERAIELGYRHIDTAAAYYNEPGVGAGLRASGRDDVFVTTKLRNADQGYDSALAAFESSRQALGVDAVDLYLIHWPVPSQDRYVDCWRALIKLRDDGLVRSIGVSNFLADHVRRIVDETGVTPSVDQLEIHPSFSQSRLREACAELGVAVEAYSPLGQGADLEADAVLAPARRLGVSPAQVVLGWHLGSGRIAIPKSVHAERMRENLAADGVALTGDELAAIDALDRPSGRIAGDPATFDFSQRLEDAVARGEI